MEDSYYSYIAIWLAPLCKTCDWERVNVNRRAYEFVLSPKIVKLRAVFAFHQTRLGQDSFPSAALVNARAVIVSQSIKIPPKKTDCVIGANQINCGRYSWNMDARNERMYAKLLNIRSEHAPLSAAKLLANFPSSSILAHSFPADREICAEKH